MSVWTSSEDVPHKSTAVSGGFRFSSVHFEDVNWAHFSSRYFLGVYHISQFCFHELSEYVLSSVAHCAITEFTGFCFCFLFRLAIHKNRQTPKPYNSCISPPEDRTEMLRGSFERHVFISNVSSPPPVTSFCFLSTGSTHDALR
jgi:hypothetical protein